MTVSRTFPALQLNWRSPPEDGEVGLVLAEVDAETPTAVEEVTNGIRVFFPSAALRDRALARLREFSPDSVCTAIDMPDDDWAARSQASLGHVTVGRIFVAPPWCKEPERPDRVRVVIQPSMGFGTGHHASTRICLRLLQELDAHGKRVIDVGTGSGVLAVAAARLGAGRVLAVDSDPDALAAAADSLRLNDLSTPVELRQLDLAADAEALSETFDLVLANLTGFLLIRHVQTLCGLAAAGGALVASGFEQDEADGVRAAFAAAGWDQDRRIDEDSWTGLSFTSIPTRSRAR